jgi:hypothetical protein
LWVGTNPSVKHFEFISCETKRILVGEQNGPSQQESNKEALY